MGGWGMHGEWCMGSAWGEGCMMGGDPGVHDGRCYPTYLHIFKHPACSVATDVVPKAIGGLEGPPGVKQLPYRLLDKRQVQGACRYAAFR